MWLLCQRSDMREMLAVNAYSNCKTFILLFMQLRGVILQNLFIFCNPTKTHEQCKELLLHQPNLSYDVSSKLSKWVN